MGEGESSRVPHSGKRIKILKRSFAETVAVAPSMADDETMLDEVDNDWLDEEIVVRSDEGLEDVREGIPVVKFSKAEREEMIKPWKRALIVKYLGKPPAFNLLKQRLFCLWNINGKVEMLDIGGGCYVLRFTLAAEYSHVLLDGPWKVFNCYVIPQRWQPDFDPYTAKMEKMAVWVRFPGLPVEYFLDGSVKKVLKLIGKPIKLDTTTAEVDKVKFARAAVEIDLLKPLVSMVWVSDRVQRVEFEGLHAICFDCGEVGHVSSKCPKKVVVDTQPQTPQEPEITMETGGTEEVAPAEKVREKYGPWMIVSYNNDKLHSKHRSMNTKTNPKPPKSKEAGNKNKKVAAGGRPPSTNQSAPTKNKVSIAPSPIPLPVSNGFSVLQGMEELHETPVYVEGETSTGVKNKEGRPFQKKNNNKKGPKQVTKSSKDRSKTGSASIQGQTSNGDALFKQPSAGQNVSAAPFVFGIAPNGNNGPQPSAGASFVTTIVSTRKEGGGQTSLPCNGGQ
ncbi:PREDICTED: uncharacterized protein LOC109154909 [Ipomoea nil]|uniref:uncharacterized protein LOC109154909 n=1 Tax=Ipomoea nil TaxID=35883 RepID=UPI000901C46F|nr:PREDICTED: uncharacterized protein LOC109154909 [Ipomoea nil]